MSADYTCPDCGADSPAGVSHKKTLSELEKLVKQDWVKKPLPPDPHKLFYSTTKGKST